MTSTVWPTAASTVARDTARPLWMLYGGVAVLCVLLSLACLTGLVGSDDLEYARYAQAMLDGTYHEAAADAPQRHQALRFALILPLVAVYKVLGISEGTTVLLPLAASLLSVLLLIEIGRRMFSLQVGIIAGLLYATFPLHLVLSTVLAPELVAECYVLSGVLCYLHARERGGSLWVAAGLLMGAAYLAKEPALFIGGAFLLHALWERRWRGALLFAAGVGAIGLLEHAYYYAVWGDVLFRSHSTQLYTLPSSGEYFAPARRPFMYRLLRKYPEMMLLPHLKFGLHSVAAVALACGAYFLKPRYGKLLVLWIVVPGLYLNFGSWSYRFYAPLPRDERYIEFLYPPLFLLSAVALSWAWRAGPAISRSAIAAFGCLLLVGLGSGFMLRGEIAYAEHMSVLREIVRTARAEPGHSIHTEERRWRQALEVFDASLVADSPGAATILLTRDPLGLPAAQPALVFPEGPTR